MTYICSFFLSAQETFWHLVLIWDFYGRKLNGIGYICICAQLLQSSLTLCGYIYWIPNIYSLLQQRHRGFIWILLIRALEEEMATHSSILTWKIPWTEKPDGMQSMRLQRVRHDWVSTHMHKDRKLNLWKVNILRDLLKSNI